MKLIDSANRSGYKLKQPQINLLTKLETDYALEASDLPEVSVRNPLSGYEQNTSPLMAVLIQWVYQTYSTYRFDGTMYDRKSGKKVSIKTFDAVRMLVLNLSSKDFSNFLD